MEFDLETLVTNKYFPCQDGIVCKCPNQSIRCKILQSTCRPTWQSKRIRLARLTSPTAVAPHYRHYFLAARWQNITNLRVLVVSQWTPGSTLERETQTSALWDDTVRKSISKTVKYVHLQRCISISEGPKGTKKDDQKVSQTQKCENTLIFFGTVKRSLHAFY